VPDGDENAVNGNFTSGLPAGVFQPQTGDAAVVAEDLVDHQEVPGGGLEDDVVVDLDGGGDADLRAAANGAQRARRVTGGEVDGRRMHHDAYGVAVGVLQTSYPPAGGGAARARTPCLGWRERRRTPEARGR